MTDQKPKLVGINHVALEVGDVAAALDFYGRIFDFTLRGKNEAEDGTLTGAFIDMGDQFLALSQGRTEGPDAHRHFGLVVDDREAVQALAVAAGAELVEGPFLDFRDPWGNRIEVVDYRDIQFSKTEAVLKAMGVSPEKSDKARQQLRDKGMA